MTVSKGARTRAADRAYELALRVEAHIADQAKATLTEKPGLNLDSVKALFADELTRRPVPNRASRRECKRRGHTPKRFDNAITICARCEIRL